jgi:hypothetical protein
MTRDIRVAVANASRAARSGAERDRTVELKKVRSASVELNGIGGDTDAASDGSFLAAKRLRVAPPTRRSCPDPEIRRLDR